MESQPVVESSPRDHNDEVEVQENPVDVSTTSLPESNVDDLKNVPETTETNDAPVNEPTESIEQPKNQEGVVEEEVTNDVQKNAPYIEESESDHPDVETSEVPASEEEKKTEEVQSFENLISVDPDEKMKIDFNIEDAKVDIPEVDPNWENWNSNDLVVQCIFDSYVTSDLTAFWKHCEEAHHFSKEYLRKEKQVSQKQWIHMVNYLRSLPESDRISAYESLFDHMDIWDNYNYRKSTLDNDPLLYLYTDNIFEEEFYFGDDDYPVIE